jgi:hypothetical protein
MSTNTTMRFTPRIVKTDYTLTENRVMNLDGLLGPGGKEVIKGALEKLSGRKELLPGESEGVLNWERVEDGGDGRHYRLNVPGQHLTTLEGLEGLTIHLRMGKRLTEVVHEAQFSRTGQSTSAVVSSSPQEQQAIRRVVNRSVNQLLAYSVAARIESKLKEKVKQKLEVRDEQRLNQLVSMRMSNRINIQTMARLRQ